MTTQQLFERNLKLAQDRDFATMREETWIPLMQNAQEELLDEGTKERRNEGTKDKISAENRYDLNGIGRHDEDTCWAETFPIPV